MIFNKDRLLGFGWYIPISMHEMSCIPLIYVRKGMTLCGHLKSDMELGHGTGPRIQSAMLVRELQQESTLSFNDFQCSTTCTSSDYRNYSARLGTEALIEKMSKSKP